MKTSEDLRFSLRAINRKSYPAYKSLAGSYTFGKYILNIEHVQGDPFAAPSRLSVKVNHKIAGFPAEYYGTKWNQTALEDYLIRRFHRQADKFCFQAKGSGKSGLLTVSRPGAQILERTACRLNERELVVRFEAGFPARGRTIQAGELIKMLFEILPGCVRKSLFYKNIDQRALKDAIELCEDQQYIRSRLAQSGLCAFIANGSILPRESGISEKPLKDAVPFVSPESLEITFSLPNRGTVTGMGIRKGITLFVGGGFHGKSTLLQALQNGVYNHISGDGRELVITEGSGVKLRAEDGRSIRNVDISPFIKDLPGRKDTVHFSTEDASGSTSQAANLIEAVESGSSLLLIDEDTSATNFMVRDELMQQVIAAKEEPITPFIDRVRELYREWGVSSVIVAGSSGSYFHVADTIIQMKEYEPLDITEKARKAAQNFPIRQERKEKLAMPSQKRSPRPNAALKKEERLKWKAFGTSELSLAKDTVELRYLEQLKDPEQTAALACILQYLELHVMDGRKTMQELAEAMEKQLDEKGLESLFDKGQVKSSLARPRRQEIEACVKRYRKLFFSDDLLGK